MTLPNRSPFRADMNVSIKSGAERCSKARQDRTCRPRSCIWRSGRPFDSRRTSHQPSPRDGATTRPRVPFSSTTYFPTPHTPSESRATSVLEKRSLPPFSTSAFDSRASATPVKGAGASLRDEPLTGSTPGAWCPTTRPIPTHRAAARTRSRGAALRPRCGLRARAARGHSNGDTSP